MSTPPVKGKRKARVRRTDPSSLAASTSLGIQASSSSIAPSASSDSINLPSMPSENTSVPAHASSHPVPTTSHQDKEKKRKRETSSDPNSVSRNEMSKKPMEHSHQPRLGSQEGLGAAAGNRQESTSTIQKEGRDRRTRRRRGKRGTVNNQHADSQNGQKEVRRGSGHQLSPDKKRQHVSKAGLSGSHINAEFQSMVDGGTYLWDNISRPQRERSRSRDENRHKSHSPATTPHNPAARDEELLFEGDTTAAQQAEISGLERAKAEALAEAERLHQRIQDLEAKAKETATAMIEKDEIIERNVGVREKLERLERVQEQLRESVTCGVCFETLSDPHTLACGHVACKACLVSWFRTPGAYVSPPSADMLAANMDLSYWTKICHVCRATVINRPIRLYHLQSILQPLGIDPHLPASAPKAIQGTAEDPWMNIFPIERDAYKIQDSCDGVERCPACLGEILDGQCVGCGAEFSDAEDEYPEDFASDDDDDEDDGGTRWLAQLGGQVDAVVEVQNDQHRRRRQDGVIQVDDDSDDGIVADAGSDDSDGSEDGRDSYGIDSGNDSNSNASSIVGNGAFSNAIARAERRDRGESSLSPARNTRPAMRNRAADQARSRAARRRQRDDDMLPPGVANFIDVFADESDDEEMTNDEGEGSIGERGDYPGASSFSEAGSSSENGEGEEEDSGYEDSFIDDDEVQDDLTGEATDRDDDDAGDSDEIASVDENVIRRDVRRTGSRAASQLRAREASEEEDAGGEVGIEEMRRRRLQALAKSRSNSSRH